MTRAFPQSFDPTPDAYRPVPIRNANDLEHLRLSLECRAEAFSAVACPPFENPALLRPGPASPLVRYLRCRLHRFYQDWPEPLDTEAAIEHERIWFDIHYEGGNPLIDATLLAMKSERTALTHTEIWRLCYRASLLMFGGAEAKRDELMEKVLARRQASAKGGKPGEVKGPHRWAWRFLVENLESVAYDSAGRRLSRYALSERLHTEILHDEWRRQHPGARFAPANCLPSAKTLRESPIWLKGMGLDDLPLRRETQGAPA